MTTGFSDLDWMVVGLYLAILLGMGWYFGTYKPKSASDYFLGGNKVPYLVVAVSVLATTQSAATFLGGPDQGFRGDYSYLAINISAILGSIFVAKILIPKFYEHNSTTVYEILGARYGDASMRAAGGMYLVGRLFAGGARLYLASIAVAMILFSNIDIMSIICASFIMMALGFLVTFMGGIRSVIWSDLFQFIIYGLSAIIILVFLWYQIPSSGTDIINGLKVSPNGVNKLRLFNFDMDFSNPWAMISILTGSILLYIGSFGLDQDITQRLLTCKNSFEGGRALLISAIVAIPVIWLFVSIGQLLHIFYERPDLMSTDYVGNKNNGFQGENITIFMFYILNELPAGLKGFVTVGVIAAAVSTINSGLNSMSSVIIQDFFRPWMDRKCIKPEVYYVVSSQISMGIVGVALFLMSVLCYYWQHYSDMPLVTFALSVMVFAYSGLLGVYFTVVFTNRGSPTSVICALGIGFFVTLIQQSYLVDLLGLPSSWKDLAFTWQLCIGTGLSFLGCQLGNQNIPVSLEEE